uniref:Uncharacterized protein n=1 Tax=Arundo donax TaxID=35708 RepID=A0A0A9EPY9_ARUDO
MSWRFGAAATGWWAAKIRSTALHWCSSPSSADPEFCTPSCLVPLTSVGNGGAFRATSC